MGIVLPCNSFARCLHERASLAGVALRWPRPQSRWQGLRQQFERVSVARANDGEVAAVQCGDPASAVALGQGDDGRVRPAEPQVSVGGDQILDAPPVIDVEVGYFYLALDDRRVQTGLRLGAKLAVDQVSGLAMTMVVVTKGPSSFSSSSRQAAWSLSARSAVATMGPVSTMST